MSEQTFYLQVEVSPLFSGGATPDEDFRISDRQRVRLCMTPNETTISFAYQIIGDLIPENQESFQLSVTPAVDSPSFSCSITKGCYQHLEVVIQDDDGE